MSSMSVRRAELLDDIVAQTSTVLADFDVALDAATREQIGHALADHFADHWGGQVLSFPKDTFYRMSARDRSVLSDHRAGLTISQLAEKYLVGERAVRKIVKRAELRDPNLHQDDLFA